MVVRRRRFLSRHRALLGCRRFRFRRRGLLLEERRRFRSRLRVLLVLDLFLFPRPVVLVRRLSSFRRLVRGFPACLGLEGRRVGLEGRGGEALC